jgi:hypothetical protein
LAPGESATLDELKARRASPGVINVKGGEAKRVYVGRSKQYGRPHYFANPYLIGEDGDREEVLEKYQEHLAKLSPPVPARSTSSGCVKRSRPASPWPATAPARKVCPRC